MTSLVSAIFHQLDPRRGDGDERAALPHPGGVRLSHALPQCEQCGVFILLLLLLKFDLMMIGKARFQQSLQQELSYHGLMVSITYDGFRLDGSG